MEAGMMQTPVKIGFQGGDPSEALTQLIHQEVEALERVYGRLTSCQVTVQIPDNHHRTGFYSVHIHLAMPGNYDVVVDHQSDNDDRLTTPQFAVNDAFRRAKRQIQDRARKMRGDVKSLHKRVDRTLDQPEG
jgi:ribosome-associated translation inhibitor RaiA